jgi:enterochelin esterase-like enzyme
LDPRSRLLVVAVAGLVLAAAGAWLLTPGRSEEPEPGGAGPRPRPDRASDPLEAVIADVEAGRRTTPLVAATIPGDQVTVTFLARRAGGEAPRIVSDVTGWGEHADGTFDFHAGTMTRVGETDWYSLDTKVERGARIEYLVAYGMTDYRPDPHNPRRAGPEPPASEFVTPGYVPPQELTDPPVAPGGRVVETSLESRALGGARRVLVYTPPGYRRGSTCPLAVFHDRFRAEDVPRVLDWLIARGDIEPIIAVFTETTPYGEAPRSGEPVRTFLAEELPRWVTSRYGTAKTADSRAILAISYGAKDALDAAITSRAFHRLGLLIPGRRITADDLVAAAESPAPRLRVAILAGRYDLANVPTARALQQALASAGHRVEYTEVPEGHSPRTWRNHLRGVLVSLFGPAHD